MQGSIRRVNKLRLSAQQEDSLPADIAALQDAFRIASLPGIPPQGLLLIKKLELGSFRSRSSALTLSHLIDSRIRNSAATAIRVDRGDFDGHGLVWFSDPAAAAVCLADNVAKNRNPRAWYWRTLFPDWRGGMGLADTLDAIAAAPHGEIPVAVVLRQVSGHLIRIMPSSSLVDAIRPRLAQSLLCDAGVYQGPPTIATEKTAAPAEPARPNILAPAWKQLIDDALARWSEADPRCLWFGYCAVTAQNPALAVNPGLHERIKTLLGSIAVATDADPTPASATGMEVTARSESTSAAKTAAAAESVQPPSCKTKQDSKPAGAAPAGPVPAEQNSMRPKASMIQSRPSRASADATVSVTQESGFDRDGQRRTESVFIESDSNDSKTLPKAAQADSGTDSAAFGGFVDSEHAGLIFTVSLLDLLAIDRLLARNPVLAEINLPALIIRDIGFRLQVPGDHPLLRALPESPPPEAGFDSFESPASWSGLIASPGAAAASLYRFDTSRSGSRCFLTDRSQRLLLYAGAGDLPRWTHQHRVIRRAGVYAVPDPRVLSQGVQLLMSRYLLRYAGISLRRLVRRPGRFASTHTHLDVLFDLEQADIRIRKAGLDINPGWITWLARVVQFHYLDGDIADV